MGPDYTNIQTMAPTRQGARRGGTAYEHATSSCTGPGRDFFHISFAAWRLRNH